MPFLGELETGTLNLEDSCFAEDSARMERLANGLTSRGVAPESPVRIFFVPGRIEVLGKHTDYAGGRSLVAATEQGIWMAASPRQDSTLTMTDLDGGSTIEFAVGTAAASETRDWSVYPRAVASRLADTLSTDLTGAEVVFESDLPMAAGLSSSSALVVAVFMVLDALNNLERHPRLQEVLKTPEQLASFLGAIESGRPFDPASPPGSGVGTEGGDQDHTAILCSCRGEIRQYSYCPTRLEKVLKVPPELGFVVAISGVEAKKAGEAREDYNRASRSVHQLTCLWQEYSGRPGSTLAEALATGPDAVEILEDLLATYERDAATRTALMHRLHHFAAESGEVVPGAAAALEGGELAAFGDWVDRSQQLATSLLDNQVKETIWLAAAARRLGAIAASAFGAGFGGSVWALVDEAGRQEFLESWSGRYCERFPEHRQDARFIWTRAGGPAVAL